MITERLSKFRRNRIGYNLDRKKRVDKENIFAY